MELQEIVVVNLSDTLPTRCYNCLTRAGIINMDQLRTMLDRDEVVRGMGPSSYLEVRNALIRLGVKEEYLGWLNKHCLDPESYDRKLSIHVYWVIADINGVSLNQRPAGTCSLLSLPKDIEIINSRLEGNRHSVTMVSVRTDVNVIFKELLQELRADVDRLFELYMSCKAALDNYSEEVKIDKNV